MTLMFVFQNEYKLLFKFILFQYDLANLIKQQNTNRVILMNINMHEIPVYVLNRMFYL